MCHECPQIKHSTFSWMHSHVQSMCHLCDLFEGLWASIYSRSTAIGRGKGFGQLHPCVHLQKSGETRECAAWVLCANERTFSNKCAHKYDVFYLNPSLLQKNDGKDQKTIISITTFILGMQPADSAHGSSNCKQGGENSEMCTLLPCLQDIAPAEISGCPST